MNYFEQRPRVFRIVFGAVAMFLFVFGGYGIYKFGKSPSDENIFEDPPSRAYVTRAFAATRLGEPQGIADSVLIGDMIVSVNGKRFPSVGEGRAYIETMSDTAVLTLEIVHPANRQRHSYSTRKSSLRHDCVTEIQPTALVVEVTPEGASDRAGMMVGDQITRINGSTFNNVAEADSILRQGQIGKTIDYEVLRLNQIVTLHVTLASFGIQFTFLLYALCGLGYVAAGMFLGLARPNYSATRVLGIFFLLAGYVMVMSILNRGFESDFLQTLRIWTVSICLFVALPVFLHTIHYFPTEHPGLLKRKWILQTGYLFSFVTFIVNRIASGSTVAITMTIGLLLYVFFIPLVGRKSSPPEYKRKGRIVRWTGLAIVLAASIFGVLANRAGGLAVLRLLGWFGVVLLAVPAAYLYTIGRYRLFNLALRVKRSVQYSFVSVIWTVFTIIALMSGISWLVKSDFTMPYVRITSSSIEVTDTPASQREQTMIERGSLVVLAIGVTLILLRVYKTGGRFISEKFHRARYDYRRAANELAEVMTTTLSMTQLAKGIVERLASLMQLKRVGLLFFRDQKECCCSEAYGFDGTSWNEFCMTVNHGFIEEFKKQMHELNTDSLPASLKGSFKEKEFHYVVPIRSKDKLVGLMLIGEKMSESAFTPEDIEFLAAVAKQASVAIENAFLYEELAEQERLKHELEIARRIQLESLPQSTPDIAGLEIAGVSIPALEVGGDYFDYLNGNPTKLTVIVGDVSGKGTSAALYMSKVQGILRSLHGFGLAPRELFIRANHLLCKDLEKRSFVTAMGAAFDTGKRSLLLARAGHLPLFHFHTATKNVEKITPRGLGLGLSAENLFATELEERLVNYNPGDVFVFVTDGITEGQKQSGDEFGEERLTAILARASQESAVAIRNMVIDEVKSFAGEASQHDDQTVVVVKAT